MGDADVNCDACDGDPEYEVLALEIRIGTRLVTVAQPGWYCWSCGAARFSAEDLDSADRQLSAGRASLKGVASPRVLSSPAKAA